MGRKPKAEPQTQAEMIESVQKEDSKLYKAQSMKLSKQEISDSVATALEQIRQADRQSRINLDDTETVKRIAEEYFEVCAVEGRFPKMEGVALALGFSRQNLYHFMKKKPNSETGKFLAKISDAMASVLSEGALRGNANPIVSIFVLKSCFGYKETAQTIELIQGDPMHEELSVDDIVERAGLLTDD